ncbi:MAG: energy transducer TonB [Bacteroidaceae bacterium]|nr:energy transducer TonB [Bacteroidaceae bacterium]
MKRTALFLALGLLASVVGVNAQVIDDHDHLDVAVISDAEHNPRGVEIFEIPESKPDENSIFQVVETQPEFPGGMAELMKYLQKNIRYPQICKEQRVQGRVIVQFVVNTDSTITDVNVVKPVNPYLDKEAVRVVEAMPKWIPGKLHGEPVRVRFTLPVTFRLPADTVKVDTVSVNRK